MIAAVGRESPLAVGDLPARVRCRLCVSDDCHFRAPTSPSIESGLIRTPHSLLDCVLLLSFNLFLCHRRFLSTGVRVRRLAVFRLNVSAVHVASPSGVTGRVSVVVDGVGMIICILTYQQFHLVLSLG